MSKVVRTLLVAAVSLSLLTVASPAQAWKFQGCTPGFWGNHPDAWPVSTDTTVGEIFSSVTGDLADLTLLEALKLNGGSGFEGAERILVRAAVASYLNALAGNFPDWITSQLIVEQTNAAIESGSRSTLIGLAEKFDRWNNTGECGSG